ncbi:glycosyltransferase [Alcanivorax sp. VBW004]|uniref:glycosyltransferase n=1 Tax=Alcanivorax sp. VBW004 TaxID=1287708 RepID=UPI0012BC3184|nr:glycosyltransferase [Alcanivorax sp. VBW004]MTT52808.1 glycosyltransferase [Alcanivorax sp. VBW004]
MNIVFVCSSLNGGGAERVAVNLANGFAKDGHSVIFFTRHKTDDCYSLESSVVRLFSDRGGLINQVLSIRRLLKFRDVDLLISFTDVPNIVAFLAWIFYKKSSVFIPTVHTNVKARDARLVCDFKFRVIRFLHKLACRNSSSVVAVSSGAASALIDYYGVEREKVATIWNPVLSDEVEVFNGHTRSESSNQVRLVAAGRLTEAKNYYLMLDALKILDQKWPNKFVLDVFGEGELRESLELYRNNIGLRKSVKFKGFVDDLQLRLLNYSVFVFSSNWEGFGNVLVEALTAGIPVVSTDCPSGPREILANERFGRLVPVGDAESLSAAIQESLSNPLLFSRNELISHLNDFRASAVLKKYMDLVKYVKSFQK